MKAPMNTLRTTTLLVFGIVCVSLCHTVEAVAEDASINLSEAKGLGRAKSEFLKESKPDTGAIHDIPKPGLSRFRKTVSPILKKNCIACHGPKRTEAELRIDELNPDLLAGADVQWWLEIYDVLSNSEMPPEDEPDYKLTAAERSDLVEWLGDEVKKASLMRANNAEGTSFRRMTKYEYSYALQDLLGLPYSLENRLPPETASEGGFKNDSELLQMSAMQFETYREIGLKALKHATVSGERPNVVNYIVSMQDMMESASGKNAKLFDAHLRDKQTGKGLAYSGGKIVPTKDVVAEEAPPISPVVLVLPRSGKLKFNLDRFLPDEGIMRVRIRAGRTTTNTKEYASFRLVFGAHTSNNANFSQVISERDVLITATAEEPEFVEFAIPLSEIPRNPFRHLSTTFPRRDEHLTIENISNAKNDKDSLKVHIDHIEISAPYFEQWPPQSHKEIFFESDHQKDEQVYAREVLTRFMARAWRRPVTETDVDPFLDLFNKYRPEFENLEDAMVEVLATVLASPEFLYLTHRAIADHSATISDFELASRLSFFLWSSIPDEELLNLAIDGKLTDRDVLGKQVERMLKDDRSDRFKQNFVHQWLGLDALNSVTHLNDTSLKAAMQNEPVAFFGEVLMGNRSVMDFIHSDYVVVNERLAAHYRIPDVFGPHFQKVPIDSKTNRGGILTAAAILAMNSDGVDSHPLKRGVWLLERILHDPPPPPPPNVPEVDLTDPEILKMSLKDRIADHRNKPACYSCHAKIDPWGIAFENYDALGSYRTTINREPVDATSTLFNKQELAGMDGLKRHLLVERQDQFARAIVHKMLAFALGRPLSFGDRAEVDKLTTQFRKKEDRLGDLIHIIVQSEVFRSR